MSKPPAYPFIPKSTAYLEPGHFWSIPLSNGRFACGRVVQLWIKNNKRNPRIFLAGLMDWSGDAVPAASDLVGCRTVDQGEVHVMTIGKNGGQIIGFRDLTLDGIEPYLFRDACVATYVQRGFDWHRKYNPKHDSHLPVSSAWGYGVIKRAAEHRFGGKSAT